jgi:hypothetical protein
MLNVVIATRKTDLMLLNFVIVGLLGGQKALP